MDAIVLAGGYATRLWPITKNRPKMFLPIGNSTVIDRILTQLENDNRIADIYISTNERFESSFEAHLEDSEFQKPRLSIEETTSENEKFGVIGALAQLIEREEIDDNLLVIAGDNLISFDVADFIDDFEKRCTPTLAAYDVGSRERASSFGLVDLDGDRIVGFQEKPENPTSTLVSIACYAFPADSLPLLSTYLADGNNPDEPGWFIQWLHDHQPTYAYTFDGAWFDIGTPESYLDAVEWHLAGDSRVADSAELENVTVGENVHIMEDASLTDTDIEHAVVFPNSTIKGGTVRRSIIDTDTELVELNLARALIGQQTQIVNSE